MALGNDDLVKRANDLLGRALAITADERGPWLRAQCGADDALHDLVARLLRIAESTSDPTWLREGLAAPGLVLTAKPLDGPAAPGDVIGQYRVAEELGRGGMAVVYRAERADAAFETPVALKMLRYGHSSKEAIARFAEECRILARIRHPRIASLLDAGVTPAGLPYFVMERVEGISIDRYVEEQRLPLSQRLRLFVQVAQAVEFAHRNLVVHRDIKPSNILVTAEGQAKLLDFGIAKVSTPDDTSNATLTGQRFLTPAWASPEQLRGLPVATASDVYQLGMLLYLLTTGQTPRGGASSDPAVVARTLEETVTTRPSVAVANASSESIERAFGVPAARLQRRLKGDLDTIVMRALDLDPERRYPSAEALIDDIERFSTGRPIKARPNSAFYLFSKLVQRHQWTSLAVATLAVVTLGFAVLMSFQARRLAMERDRANSEAELAKQVSQFLKDVFKVSDPSQARGSHVTARELLDKLAGEIDQRLPEPSAKKAELHMTVGQVYRGLGLYKEAEPHYRNALEIYRHLPTGGGVAELSAQADLGVLLREEGRLDEAQTLLESTLQARKQLLGPEHPDTLTVMHNLAAIMTDRQDNAKVEPVLRELYAVRTRVLGPDHIDTLRTLINLAVTEKRLNRLDDAERDLRTAVDGLTRTLGRDNPSTLAARVNLAALLTGEDGQSEGERMLEEVLADSDRVLGADSTLSQVALQNLAIVYEGRKEFGEAEKLYRRSLASLLRTVTVDHPQVINTQHNLGLVLAVQNKELDGAAVLLQTSLASARRVQGEDSPLVARGLAALAILAERRGQRREAITQLRAAVDHGFDGPALLIYLKAVTADPAYRH